MNETDNKQEILEELESDQLEENGQIDEQADIQEDLPSDDLSQIIQEDSDDSSAMFSFPNIAQRISTRAGLYSAFLVLIPLLIASTLAFMNQGASKQTQEAVQTQLSENANRVADSMQWQLGQLASSGSSIGSSGALLPTLERELDYLFYDTLYDVAAPLDSSINTSSHPKLKDVLQDVATPIEAEGGLLYVYDSTLRQVYASPDASADVDQLATSMLKDFSGEQLTEVSGETAYVKRRALPAADWQMVLYQPAPAASASNIALMRPLAWLTALAPLLALLLGNLWGFFNFQRPLNELRDAVQRLLSGRQTASVPRNRKDELGLLTKEVSLLSQKFSAVVLEEAEPKERLFEAQERIRQQYLKENYPDQFEGEDEVTEDIDTVASASSSTDKDVAKAEAKNKELAKQSEADKKAIAELEKAVEEAKEEARAAQTNLTESKLALESQLKDIENEKLALEKEAQNLVSKEKYEADLAQLHKQLIDRSKVLKGHIRAAKASAVGFNVADSETKMNAAAQELDELDGLLSDFGRSALGIEHNDGTRELEQSAPTKASASKREGKQSTTSSENKTTVKQDASVTKSPNNAKSQPVNQQRFDQQPSKDMADGSKPLQSSTSGAKTKAKKNTKADTKKNRSQDLNKSGKQTVVENLDMLTPLPNSGVAATVPVVANAIAAKDIDASHGVINQVEEVKEKTVVESKSDSAQVNITKSPDTSETSDVDVSAIDYDAAIALEIDKNNSDLKAALESYLQQFKDKTQLQVEGYISLVNTSERNTVLIRDFVKAAFDNIAQHSDATSVLLELNPSKDGSKLDLMIVDNGKGFDADKLAKDSKLEQFKKAFSILNGELILYSSGSEGTILTATLVL